MTAPSGWVVLAGPGAVLLEPPPGPGVAAVMVPSRDVFADPPALAVRAAALDAAGGLERVRAGALADLAARLEAAGERVERRPAALPPRGSTVRALLREGSGRFWLWRRRPDRHPLPTPRDVGVVAYALLALGALHANGTPTPPSSAARPCAAVPDSARADRRPRGSTARAATRSPARRRPAR